MLAGDFKIAGKTCPSAKLAPAKAMTPLATLNVSPAKLLIGLRSPVAQNRPGQNGLCNGREGITFTPCSG